MQSQYDAGLVLILGGARTATARAGVAFGDLGADEREGNPERERPRKADEAGEHGGGRRAGNEEGRQHADGEEQLGEHPGAPQGEARDLAGRQEPREPGVGFWAGKVRCHARGHCRWGRGTGGLHVVIVIVVRDLERRARSPGMGRSVGWNYHIR